MRNSLAGAACVGAALVLVLVVPGAAQAQRRRRPEQPTPFQLQKEQLGSTAYGEAGRARMRRGDCVGALEAFDAAIRTSIDPTLRRDRGLCHEKLNDPHPAIEDYRAYLTAMPDAPDADDIRDRLFRLEAQVGEGGRSDAKATPSDEPEGDRVKTSSSSSSSGSGASGALSVSASTSGGTTRKDRARDPD